jgi:hypothetical protein
MKTQLIQLVNHDDLISIRDRMVWAKTPRILLMWPKRGRVDIRPLDLALLKRHAESLGAELGLVTRNFGIRSAARRLGISVFFKSSDAQKKQWMEKKSVHPVRRFPRVDLRAVRKNLPSIELFSLVNQPVRRVIVFGVGVLAVLLILLVFIPSAEIQITPPETIQALTISVNSVPDIQDVQISGTVPQRELILTEEGEASALATGSLFLMDGVAQGEVQLTNLTNKAISVPAGTGLLSKLNPSASFITSEQVEVPAGKGKTAMVLITALTPGPDGNIPAGAVNILEGSQGLVLSATNPLPISGGSKSMALIATDQDRESLKRRLLADLQRNALVDFSNKITQNDLLFPSTLRRLRILEEVFAPPAGDIGEKVNLHLRVEYRVAYSSYADLYHLAKLILNSSIPVGFVASSGEIEIEPVSSFSEGQDIVRWQMQMRRKITLILDQGQVISLVQGKTRVSADNLLMKTYNLKQSPQIDIRPGWWPWLPFLPIQINIRG